MLCDFLLNVAGAFEFHALGSGQGLDGHGGEAPAVGSLGRYLWLVQELAVVPCVAIAAAEERSWKIEAAASGLTDLPAAAIAEHC